MGGSVYKCKGLHDDGNGAFSPSIWQSVQEDPNNSVSLMFLTTTDTMTFRSTEKRFVWFWGLCPHKSVVPDGEVESCTQHIHHSSYIKLELEQLALVTLHMDNQGNARVTKADRTQRDD